MRRIVVMSLGLMVVLPAAAWAQPAVRGPGGAPLPGQEQNAGAGRPGDGVLSAEARASLLSPGTPPPAGSAPDGGVPPQQRPPRPDNAIGPDLAGAIFAPIGVIVAPLTDALHGFDAAIAPINEAFQPLTGPYGAEQAAGPEGAPVPPAAVPAAAPTAPARIGPRK